MITSTQADSPDSHDSGAGFFKAQETALIYQEPFKTEKKGVLWNYKCGYSSILMHFIGPLSDQPPNNSGLHQMPLEFAAAAIRVFGKSPFPTCSVPGTHQLDIHHFL